MHLKSLWFAGVFGLALASGGAALGQGSLPPAPPSPVVDPTPPHGPSFQDGMEAFHAGNFAEAVRIWTLLANAGNHGAQNNLAVMYENGQGVPQDYRAAEEWYRKAADQGYAPAQLGLGSLYEGGRGMPQAYGTAAVWYQKAADQGLGNAQYALGLLYEDGHGVVQDNAQAYMWFTLAAKSAHDADIRDAAASEKAVVAKAMTVPQVTAAEAIAVAWTAAHAAPTPGPVQTQKPIPVTAPPLDGPGLVDLTFKAQLGFASAQTELGEAYLGERGHNVATDYAAARAWLLKAADQGFDGAETDLGRMYQYGYGVPVDNGMAAAWFRKAADQGWGYAQFKLGELYDKGLGVAGDAVQAYRWYGLSAQSTRGQLFGDDDVKARDAVAAGMTSAQVAQAQALISAWTPAAETPEQQATRGFDIYTRNQYGDALSILAPLAKSGNALAQFAMGSIYDFGDGVTADPAAAAAWYRKAADQGHAGAQLFLAGMYRDGKGVQQDDHQAFVWERAAAEQGLGMAQAGLATMYLRGTGVWRNPATAIAWLRKAADQGNDMGQLLLGTAYSVGGGVAKDPVEAFKWASLTLIYSHNPEIRQAATKLRDGLSTTMTANQVSKALAQIKAFFPVLPKP